MLRLSKFSLLALVIGPWLVPAAVAEETPVKSDSVIVILGPREGEISAETVFNLIDQNKDGKIDREELRLRRMNVFFVRDVNGDNYLSREEFSSISDELFDTLDTDGDGRISGFEFNQSKIATFEAIDSDGDGVITLDEFRAFRFELKYKAKQ